MKDGEHEGGRPARGPRRKQGDRRCFPRLWAPGHSVIALLRRAFLHRERCSGVPGQRRANIENAHECVVLDVHLGLS